MTFDNAQAMESNGDRIDAIRAEVTHAADAKVLDTGEFELAIAHLHVPELV